MSSHTCSSWFAEVLPAQDFDTTARLLVSISLQPLLETSPPMASQLCIDTTDSSTTPLAKFCLVPVSYLHGQFFRAIGTVSGKNRKREAESRIAHKSTVYSPTT